MHGTIGHLVETYGYWFLFLLVAVESFGIPLPGETALVTAAAFAARGRLNILLVIVAAAGGAIFGDNAGYWIGRKGGLALVRRFGKHVGLTDAKLERVHGFFDRHGSKTIFFARFIALLRSWAAALAGVARMSYATFMLFNALGGIVWASAFGWAGYAFGHNLPRLEHQLGRLSIVLAALAAVVILFVIGLREFRKHR